MSRALVRVAVLAGLPACTGNIAGAPEPGAAPEAGSPAVPGGSASPGVPAASKGGGPAAGTRPLRRLTRLEYNNTVRDLLGDTTLPANAFPEDMPGGNGFALPTNVSRIEADRFGEAAAALASAAVAKMPALIPCDPAATGESACAGQFIEKLGRRAYRRPITAAEKTDLQALFAKMRQQIGFDFKTSVAQVMRAMLQSPRFLYHWEQGEQAPVVEGGLVRLTPHEVASRLSYFLWSTMPDDKLFAAADGGALATAAQIEAQARRMIADPRARDSVRSLFAQLFDYERVTTVSKDPKLYPKFNTDLAMAMAAETDAFVRSVVLDGDGRLQTLLTAPYTYVNAALAAAYGLPAVTGTELQRVALDPAQRAGVLTQGAFLATHALPAGTSPVQRGKVIRLQVMCQSVPPPPADVDQSLPAMAANSSTRAKYEAHATIPACKACHGMMDPLGFGLENFDGVGAYRTMEGKVPVDASGSISQVAGGDRAFNGPVELARALASTEEVSRCMATQAMRWLTGRTDEDGDRPSVDGAYQAFAATGLNVRELMVGITRSPGFALRMPAASEVLR